MLRFIPKKEDMEIFDLLESKSFEALNEGEKSFVLAQMTQQEYEEQHELLKLSESSLSGEEVLLIPQTPTKALEALHKKKQRGAVFFFSQSVSLWKAAAACILLLGAYHYWFVATEQSPEKVYVTEYVDREIYIHADPDTVVEKVVVEVEKTKVASAEPYAEALTDFSVDRQRSGWTMDEMAILSDVERELSNPRKNGGISVENDTLTKEILGI